MTRTPGLLLAAVLVGAVLTLPSAAQGPPATQPAPGVVIYRGGGTLMQVPASANGPDLNSIVAPPPPPTPAPSATTTAPAPAPTPPATAPAPASAPSTASMTLEQKFEELARREAELRKKEAELKAREDRLANIAPPQPPGTDTAPANDAVPQPELIKPLIDPMTGMPTRMTKQMHEDFVARLTDQQVGDSMKKGIDALLKLVNDANDKFIDLRTNGQPLGNGKFMPANAMILDHQFGELSLGVYALLALHRVTGDERCHFGSKEMAPAVKTVLEYKTFYTYGLSTQASALSMLPNKPEFRQPLVVNRDALFRGSRNLGNYTYYVPGLDGKPTVPYYGANPLVWDNSNAQYGLLGVWAADEAGVETRNIYWKQVDTHWRKSQEKDGGWGYFHRDTSPVLPGRNLPVYSSSTNTMTAAGVASLFVTMDHLDSGLRLDPVPDFAVQAGLDWMAKDFEQSRLSLGMNLYLAYAIERVGLASGLKYFGKYNWYREGAAAIAAAQRPSGEWSAGYGNITCTSYALLFLARGRSPVVVNKLAWGGPWNARPRDAANLKRWLVKRTERSLNFQVVELANEPEDWLDAPILLITGHGDPKFTPEQLAKLRRYVEAGGMIFSTADGGDPTFTDVIRRKYAPAICDKQYEMRQLPPEHYVYTLDYRVAKGQAPTMWGVSNGVRELWVHSPVDMGGAWQTYANAKKEYWEVPANLYFYVSGRASLRSKLDSVLVPAPRNPPTESLAVGQLQYAGNCDPEPGALERLARLAALRHNTKLEITPVKALDLDVARTPVVHLTGTVGVSFPDKDREKLRSYLQAGGFLFIDAAGGSEAFDESVKALLAQVLPEGKLEAIDTSDHPVTTGQLTGGERLKVVELRRFCNPANGTARRPYVYQLTLDKRPVALFFEADVASGLLGTNTWGIFGYTSATSESLAWNTLKYAASLAPKKEAAGGK